MDLKKRLFQTQKRFVANITKIDSGIKFKSSSLTQQLVMRILPILGGITAAILFFFAIIFALASSYVGLTAQAAQSRVLTSAILFIVGLAVIVGVYYVSRKPKTIIQQLEISGQMKAAQIKCPNCGGSIDANQIKIVSGVPYIKCPYCGTTFEVTEEPKW
jgi:DNA-directed RNA polymerase subunit RPC12/RpoP